MSKDQLYETTQRVTGLFETQISCTKTYKHLQIYDKRFKGRGRL